MVMMEKQTRTDRISNLPWDVLDAILVHLPLKDAARTSILSSKWRYKWISLSQFVFDDKCFSNTLLNKVDRWGEIMKIIHRVQKNHSGQIDKFKLAAYCCPNHLDLDQWMHFLAEKGIKEFVLKEFYFIRRFKLPCCLFSCQQLRHLELYGCTFKLPPEFKGFKCLASLQLRQVCVDSDTLESLILQCPVLESLILLKIDGLTCLKIHNPNLKYLKIYTEFGNIYLENNPLLSSIDIHPTSVNLEMNMFCSLEEWKACNLFRVLGCLSGVKRLSLSGHFLEFLGTSNVPERLPERFNRLMALELREVSFKSLNEVMVFLAILQSAPNLEELSISHRDLEVGSYDIPIVEFLKSRYLLGSLNHLQVVRMRGIMVSRPEWELIKLILASSPALKTMTIVKYRGSRIPESVFLQVERASENAKIISLTL
ncbi:F-box/FBD/LRR-repeat protein At1g13570-like isoform X1 [Vitis riparia]|uniref:F-box/FBD/LRR-repeat protein At1g13570-like isoform X1 n=1 Tax=Vitis riparia TaxID=96939 RepID=UPI00155AF86C|nr:F-box/FBD/LRR-repeat protein At1g13570-like isoform X1 [Vitis riparia]XP_034706738.1 F-box/FBD/LRR-repeat protein At1g13570-like isoform X1 [Vitis riparia]XP_034706739.1 F-box/FBD/LRR-repeat protein At1g13570-like isoform X1 [Vitis riparia]XP_034706740.1 F-box/FBD/LRR-repeat protein At1g13570-like isoform X1 [Vitis riparia]XP_034706741.1 F-box/FBD/LRR-repeat protein At1g13570-like isoform X1 [Vitis riparia]XP_034706742.1 F-box/FBD/LRR-repeat protein At1g13570-like isoform X1 [Vitis riparia]